MLLLGAGGMLGTALVSALEARGGECRALTRGELDITNSTEAVSVIKGFAGMGGRVVVNAAAYTDVEGAEGAEAEAFRVNAEAPGMLAAAARKSGIRFVHVSTDFVFDGTKPEPYVEEDPPNPLNAYGRSKLAGERAVMEAAPDALLVRTSWVYGPGGNNFPRKILQSALEGNELRVVVDEVGSPTYTADLARGILHLVALDARGEFHLAGQGSCSRFEMAQGVVEAAGLTASVAPVSADTFPSKARRPANSVFSCEKARRLGVELPPWRESLREYVRGVMREESLT
ncbi:MAG TPA: dTDP-4-dehydrorhamnose reductase [Thermoleophilia bacterium]|nr:dTDP-4-dehydrorhamnose reductase [Thermoleophilia bacterium]